MKVRPGIQLHAMITVAAASRSGRCRTAAVGARGHTGNAVGAVVDFAGISIGLSLASFYRLFFVMLAGIVVIIATGYFAFSQGWWFSVMSPALGWLASAGLMTAYLSRYERRQRGLLMNLFARHVSTDVADEIWRNREQYFAGGRLRAQKLGVTTLFSDIEHFTAVSEKLDPESLMGWLNEYMEEMATLIMEHDGIVDDFYGRCDQGGLRCSRYPHHEGAGAPGRGECRIMCACHARKTAYNQYKMQ